MKEKMFKVKYMITKSQNDIKTKSVKVSAHDLEQLKCMDNVQNINRTSHAYFMVK